MIIHDVVQGSPEWLALRTKYFTASEAGAMLGYSKYQTRTQLLTVKKTGLAAEVSESTQRLFDKGHDTEALARVIVERMIGEDLFPATVTDGDLLASLDGMTMLGDTLFEHKLLNADLVRQVQANDLEPHYWTQLEQALHIAGADRVIFATSDGTEENFHWTEYRAVPGRMESILQGWKQFAIDLADHAPAEAAPAVIAAPVVALPAISYRLDGLSLTSNLDAYKASAQKLVEESKRKLETDQDFADRDALNKTFKDAEAKIALVQEQVVGEIKDVDAFCRELGDIAALIRTARLNGEKQVTARKEAIRAEIKQGADEKLRTHIAAINARLGKVQLPAINADFANAMKGKKTITSLRDAVDSELARALITVNATADVIEINLTSLREHAAGKEFLFSDAQQLVLKPNDDLVNLIKARITEHDASEKIRIDAAAKKLVDDAEAERVRKLALEQAEQAKAAHVEPTPAPTQNKRTYAPLAAVHHAPITQPRVPSDAEIISAVAAAFGVTEETAKGWILKIALAA